MLYLLFQLGHERYALAANQVVEVVPLVALRRIPHAPRGVAGIFSYRGRPVPALDLSEFTGGPPCKERLSTRIIVVKHPDACGREQLLGLIAEEATQTLRADPGSSFVSGVNLSNAPYLGRLLMDGVGAVQLLEEKCLLPDTVRDSIFSAPAAFVT